MIAPGSVVINDAIVRAGGIDKIICQHHLIGIVDFHFIKGRTGLGGGEQIEIIVHQLTCHHDIIGQGFGIASVQPAALKGFDSQGIAEIGDCGRVAGMEIVQVFSSGQNIAYFQTVYPADIAFVRIHGKKSAAGKTVDAAEVWGNSVAYLKSVDSPEGDEVPNYRTQVILNAEEVKSLTLASYPGADLSGDPSTWFGQASRNDGGGVISIPLGGVTLTGGQVRSLFSLRSACFTTAWDGTQFTFDVTGYGHGVGMSQYGANAMAKSGSGFEDILTWYYTGAEVGQLW